MSLLGRCADKFDWEQCGTNEQTIYNLTPEQLRHATQFRGIADTFKRQAIQELKLHGKADKKSILILKELAKDKSIYIARPGKGKGVEILDKQDYVNKMLDILNDPLSFETIDEDLTLKKEDQLIRILQIMMKRGFLSKEEYERARSRGSNCARMYGLPKIHTEGIAMRPVISSIGSYNYRLAKVISARIEPSRHSQYILRDTFDFIDSLKGLNKKMTKQQMFSFDVNSLYTKGRTDNSLHR